MWLLLGCSVLLSGSLTRKTGSDVSAMYSPALIGRRICGREFPRTFAPVRSRLCAANSKKFAVLVWFNGRTAAFQAVCVGSTPITGFYSACDPRYGLRISAAMSLEPCIFGYAAFCIFFGGEQRSTYRLLSTDCRQLCSDRAGKSALTKSSIIQKKRGEWRTSTRCARACMTKMKKRM